MTRYRINLEDSEGVLKDTFEVIGTQKDAEKAAETTLKNYAYANSITAPVTAKIIKEKG